MLFNSNEFLRFFLLFLVGYVLACRHLWMRNLLIVAASYTFYSFWDIRFTGLLFLTSAVDYAVGRLIEATASRRRRRVLLITSLSLNLGVLGLFKYFNFFRSGLEHLLGAVGAPQHWQAWDIILPVGISFYTFQSISYVVDVYRRQLPASRDLIRFLAYVSFFPQLVAGPIERATNLLPQFDRTLRITSDLIESGVWLIVWGMFKKVVLADNFAPLVELVYDHPMQSGVMVVLGTIGFAFQVYCDFSGYTDIARGLAQLLGFKLMLNFSLPYFATSLRDFWRRWHISLSTWLKDYIYIPLGGSRLGEARLYVNLGITLFLGGLWHGAAATFVLWGAWHGAGLIINHAWERHQPANRRLPGWAALLATQAFVLASWMLFRARSLDQVVQFGSVLFNLSLPPWWWPYLKSLAVLTLPLLAMELWERCSGRMDAPEFMPRWLRGILQAAMILAIVAFWPEDSATPFIYFQF